MGCRGERGRRSGRHPAHYLVPVVPARTGVPRRLLRLVIAALAAVIGVLLVGAVPAGAQSASLVSSDPADGASLQTPPAQLVLTFDQEIGDSTVSVACNSDPWAEPNIGRPELGADKKSVTVAIVKPMPVGSCNVAWSVRLPNGDDGPSGRFDFTVLTSPTPAAGSTPTTTPGGSTAPTTTAAAAPTTGTSSGGGSQVHDAQDVSDGATWLGRTLSTFGLAVLFGSLVLIVVAWPEGPEYILAVRFLRSVWILTFVGTLLYVVALERGGQRRVVRQGPQPERRGSTSWMPAGPAGLRSPDWCSWSPRHGSCCDRNASSTPRRSCRRSPSRRSPC